jgi:hypothetical protein
LELNASFFSMILKLTFLPTVAGYLRVLIVLEVTRRLNAGTIMYQHKQHLTKTRRLWTEQQLDMISFMRQVNPRPRFNHLKR